MTTPETTLRLIKQPSGTEIPFPANSGTFIDCDLSPIADSAHLARDVNGNLIDLGDSRFRKYALTLSCGGGVQLPGLANLWPGMAFTVELPVVLKEPGTTPSREAVEGSVRLVGGYVEYRPVMSVMLTQNSLQETEWRGRSSGWSLSFEEIDAEFSDAPVLPEEVVEATGGIVTDYVDDDGVKWREHRFLSTSALTVSKPGLAELFLVAGGGGGGNWRPGGGGGGGGVLNLGRAVLMRLEQGVWPVAIGAGGSAGSGSGTGRHGRSGNDTTFGSLARAYGGGGGGGYYNSLNPYRNGASGGGGCSGEYSHWDNRTPGTGLEGQGSSGGLGGNLHDGYWASGGGGGAGGPGGDADGATGVGGSGGSGVPKVSAAGELTFAAGGAGAGEVAGGIGGDGGASSEPGAPNTGNGGGGAGQNGGSGIVIIRYRIA